jgi:hypothetical protein
VSGDEMIGKVVEVVADNLWPRPTAKMSLPSA